MCVCVGGGGGRVCLSFHARVRVHVCVYMCVRVLVCMHKNVTRWSSRAILMPRPDPAPRLLPLTLLLPLLLLLLLLAGVQQQG